MHRLKSWLPVIVWAILISVASTDAFSSHHTSRFILPILHWLFPHATANTIEQLHVVIRKCAHVFEYFVFSLLLFRTLRGGHYGWRLQWAMWAMVIVASYSLLDEFHQSFVPSRGSHITDSLLDTCAGAAAQIAIWWWIRSRAKSQPQPTDDDHHPVAAN